MADHAKLSPSSASRWLYCTKAPEECEGIESPSSSYAEEGTLAHKFLEQWILTDLEPDFPSEYPDMRDAVAVAYNFVHDLEFQDFGVVVLTEDTVYPNQLGTDDVWGTADVVIYDPRDYALYIIDYKHGAGVPVEIDGNEQLQIYALGALSLAKEKDWFVTRVEMIIIQPRIPGRIPIQACRYTVEEIQSIAVGMAEQIAKIGTPDAVYHPADKTCRWCPAKATCSAVKAVVRDVVPFEDLTKESSMVEAVDDATEHELLVYFNTKKLLLQWMDAMDARLMDIVSTGGLNYELKLVAGRQGNRAWGLKDEELIATMLKNDLKLKPMEIYTQKLLSPTAIEKVLKTKPERGMAKKWEAFEAMLTRSPGKAMIVPVDDKRPALETAKPFEALEA